MDTEIDENELIALITEVLPKKYSEVTTVKSSNPNITYEVMRETSLRLKRKCDRFHENVSKAFIVMKRETLTVLCVESHKYDTIVK